MKLLKKILLTSLCSAMIVNTGMTSFAGVIGKSSNNYPKVVMGETATKANDGTYLNGAYIKLGNKKPDDELCHKDQER